jgi:hypothetical protein
MADPLSAISFGAADDDELVDVRRCLVRRSLLPPLPRPCAPCAAAASPLRDMRRLKRPLLAPTVAASVAARSWRMSAWATARRTACSPPAVAAMAHRRRRSTSSSSCSNSSSRRCSSNNSNSRSSQ